MNLKQMQELNDYKNDELITLTDNLKYKMHKKIIYQEYRDKVDSLNQKRRLNFQGKNIYNLWLISLDCYINKLFNLDWHHAYKDKKFELKEKYIYEKNLCVGESEIKQNQDEYLTSLNLLKKEFSTSKDEFKLETDAFLKSIFTERAKIIEQNDKNALKKLALEAKQAYVEKLTSLKKQYKNTAINISKNKYLTTYDGNLHRDFISDLSKDKITNFKKSFALKQKDYQITCTSINKEDGLSKIDKKIKKLVAKRPLLESKSKFSYNGIFEFEKNELKIALLKNIKEINFDFASKIAQTAKELEQSQNQSSDGIKNELKDLRNTSFKKWIGNWTSLAKRKMTFKMLKGLNAELKFNYFSKRKEIIFSNNQKQIKQELKNLKFNKRVAVKNQRLLYNSNISELSHKIPIRVNPFTKFLSTFFGTIIPGVGDIINGQVRKGLWKLLATGFAILLVMYAFGIGNVVGNGIFGLVNLGHADQAWLEQDARYFLIEGTIGVLFLAIVLVYCLLSGWSTWKVAEAKEMGARTKTWLETKSYFQTVGYPIGTTIPAFVMVLFVIIVPILTTILLAFTNYGPNNTGNFDWRAGNAFKKIFTKEWSITMGNVFLWTMIWTFATWITSFLIAFILAMVSNNERVKGKILFRLVYILPWAIPGFITILLFRLCFTADNILAKLFDNNDFLTQGKYAKIAVLMIQMWSGYCVNFVLITGILQSISKDLYEAAAIDGASGWKKTIKVTVPLVVYQMTPILIGQFMACFNNFSIIYLYNTGGPAVSGWAMGAGATDTIASLIYRMVLGQNVAIASALNVIVSIAIVTVSLLFLLRSKSVKGGIN